MRWILRFWKQASRAAALVSGKLLWQTNYVERGKVCNRKLHTLKGYAAVCAMLSSTAKFVAIISYKQYILLNIRIPPWYTVPLNIWLPQKWTT